MRRSEILQTLAARREDLARMGVKSMAIFGSVARDEARPDSDVDILVEFQGSGHLQRLHGSKVLPGGPLGPTRRSCHPQVHPATTQNAHRE